MEVVSYKLRYSLVFITGFMATTALIAVNSCKTQKGPKMFVTPHATTFNIPHDRIVKKVLPNGMTILAFQDKTAPQVLVQIAYDIGSAVEQSHERGLAHLIEHMIFKGTNSLIEGDIDAIARKFGASFNAYTSQDVTSYYFQTNNANWKPFVNILVDCMQNAKFDSQHLASELRAVVQELNMYRDHHLSSMIQKVFQLGFAPNHPYHFPIIGFKEELAHLTAAELKVFYQKYYHPDRATLFLVGDIDLIDDVELVTKVFSQLPASKSAPRANFPPIILEPVKNETTVFHDVQVPWSCFYWVIPGHQQNGLEVANVLNSIVANGAGSRLYRKLVDELKIAAEVSSYACVLDQAGLFMILFSPNAGKMQECYEQISLELEKLIAQPVEAGELQRAVAGEVMNFLTSLEDPSDLVGYWIDSFFVRRDELELFRYPEKVSAITAAQLSAYVKAHLNPIMASKINLLPLANEQTQQLWSVANDKIRAQEEAILKNHQRTTEIEEGELVHTLPAANKIEFNFPKPTHNFMLSNGLRVLVNANKKLPLVSAKFAFKDGEYYEHAKDGFAADLMVSMLIENSQGRTKQECVDNLDALGAMYQFNCAGGMFSVPSANFDQTLELFWLVLTRPEFRSADLQKLQVIHENSLKFDQDKPNKRAKRALWQELYAGTDYDWGFAEALKLNNDTTLAQIKAVHQQLVNPHAMVLSIVGDVDVEALKQQLEALAVNWQGNNSWQPRTLPAPKQSSSMQQTIPMLRDQAVLLFGRGSEIDIYHPESAPVQILNMILFESLGSRLFQLRERTGLFYGASGSFGSGKARGKGIDVVTAILNPGNVERASRLIEQVLDEAANNGIKQDELDAAKQMYLRNLIQLAAFNDKLSGIFAGLYTLDLPFDYHQKNWEKVQSLTVEDINLLAKKYSNLRGMAKIQVGGVAK